jgi:type IV pilus assembly protein PilM
MFKTKALIAVDIGSSSIKMVEIVGNPTAPSMKKFAMEPLPTGAIEHGLVVDAAAITTVIKKLVSQIGAKGRRAAISVSGSGVMLKKIQISAGKDSTVSEQVSHHAAQAFQLDLSEMYFDYVELGESFRNAQDSDVLIVGARREVIEQYVSVVKDAGLEIGAMEASAISVANMFEMNYGIVEGLVALVSIGASHLQIGFIETGRLLYSQEMPIGGDQYTESIMQAMNISREGAESIKITASGNPNGAPAELRRVVADTNSLIASDIKQSIGLFRSTSEAEGVGPLKYCFLTGGACRTALLDSAIAEALSVPVHFANPFQRVKISAKNFRMEHLAGIGPIIGSAVGLGVRERGDKVAI